MIHEVPARLSLSLSLSLPHRLLFPSVLFPIWFFYIMRFLRVNPRRSSHYRFRRTESLHRRIDQSRAREERALRYMTELHYVAVHLMELAELAVSEF